MKKLYFVRHGRSAMNTQGLWSSLTDTPLIDEGREQAKMVGRSAKADGLVFDLIVSSPLSRALETAQIIARETGYPPEKIMTSELLVERNLGALEGTVFKRGAPTKDVAGFEHDPELVKRARKALDWIEGQPADYILVVAHGGIGRALRSLVQADFPMSHPHRLGNAELHEWL